MSEIKIFVNIRKSVNFDELMILLLHVVNVAFYNKFNNLSLSVVVLLSYKHCFES